METLGPILRRYSEKSPEWNTLKGNTTIFQFQRLPKFIKFTVYTNGCKIDGCISTAHSVLTVLSLILSIL